MPDLLDNDSPVAIDLDGQGIFSSSTSYPQFVRLGEP
jgi:hypothetical protein